MQFVTRKSEIVNGEWLPDMDLNHDKQIQSLLCYRYTIGQTDALERLKCFMSQSSRQTAARLKGAPLDTTTRNFLPLPARHEWGEGLSIKVASSPPPSPPVGGEGRTSAPARRW